MMQQTSGESTLSTRGPSAPQSIAVPPSLAGTPWFSSNAHGPLFRNPWSSPPIPGPRELIRWRTTKNPFRQVKRQQRPLPVVEDASTNFESISSALKALWVGHATLLFEVDGRRVLVDPIFGRAGGVVARCTAAPVDVAGLPRVDVVCITHGHHDHLDRRALRAIAERFGDEVLFAVPLGLERVLPSACRRVVCFDWWQTLPIGDGVEIVFVPAQHWHRRGLFDQNRALWGGWVVRGTRAAYHSGDTGYFDGFSAIGGAVGPLDVAVLPLGAYEPTWFMSSQHMAPECSVRAFDALGARHFLGMHWGTYDLSDEPIDEGPRRLDALIEGRADAGRFWVARHGATFSVGSAGQGALSHRHEHPPREPS
jgi:N-acyl-phosphatidylethanolamine-hydrolysing phospholipase D